MLLPSHPATSGTLPPDGPPPAGPPSTPVGPDRSQAEFLGILERQLAQCRRFGQPLVALSIGIDRVCTLDGRPMGELESAVSHELWNRLRARTRAKDSVLRLAAVEFGVVLPGCRPKDGPVARQRLAVALGGVYALGSDPVVASVSIGLASHTTEVDSAVKLWAGALEGRQGSHPSNPLAGNPVLRRR